MINNGFFASYECCPSQKIVLTLLMLGAEFIPAYLVITMPAGALAP